MRGIVTLCLIMPAVLCTFSQQQSLRGLTEAERTVLPEIIFEEVDIPVDDGLSLTETAEYIVFDEEGILWTVIGTGLFRFNGHTSINLTDYLSKKYGHDFGTEFGTTFLLDNDVIWYGGRRGLYKIDRKTITSEKVVLDEPMYNDRSKNFHNFRNFITRIQRYNDALYIGTANGLYLLDPKSNQVIKSYLNQGTDFGHRQTSKGVKSIYPDVEDGALWVAMNDGFYRIDTTTGQHEVYTVPEHYAYTQLFYTGHLYDNTLIMPSFGHGIVEFDLEKKAFTKNLTGHKPDWEYNFTLTIIPLNDSLMLTNTHRLGNAIYNQKTGKYFWIKTNEWMMNQSHLYQDRSGYVWSGRNGRLFRTTGSIVKDTLPWHHIIDVTAIMANDELKNSPAIEGYDPLWLNKEERNLKLDFALSKAFLYDSIRYEYSLNNDDWVAVEEPNHLSLYNLKRGNNKVEIRALHENKVKASRELSVNIARPFYLSPIFIIPVALLLIGISYLLGRMRQGRKQKEREVQQAYEMQLNELEVKALRSQINPHFIFNTLNSIKFYAVKKSKEETSEFISNFSSLIRQILENSKKNLIPLKDEIETISTYIGIEKLRFRSEFEYSLSVADNIDQDNFMVPPMIIQPFIENAIWHGLMHKDGERKLNLQFTKENGNLVCNIEDNGIGRKAAQEISHNRPHKSSLGMSITNDRLEQLEKLYNLKSSFEVIDLYDSAGTPAGTKVLVKFQAV